MNGETYLKPLTGKVKPRSFAVFDIETTVNLERAFLLGFYDGQMYKVFEDKRPTISQPHLPEDTRGPVSQFLSWLFSSPSYTNHWIYAHNGGNFDFLYLVRWLMAHPEEYSFSVVPLQSSILCLAVSDKPEPPRKTPRTWTFLDSYRLMNAPLEKLGLAFTGEGKVKDINYKTLHRDPRRYDYLEQDVKLLYRCLESFYSLVTTAGGEIGMTAPSSAMKSFRRMHLEKWIPINRCFPGCKCEESK
jgi:hypothetical protein